MSSRGGRLTPYLVGLPGGLWLGIFFVVPILVMLSLSLQSGNAEEGFRFTWAWSNYADAWEFYHTQFVRSIIYGLIVTVLCLVLAYPMAYWIAFYGGTRKSTYLFLILLPFFVSFVIRTASWKFILNDEGFVFGPLKDAGLLPGDFHILATSTAVIGGLTYNYLPFMVLPLYVALERIDPSLVEAAYDLFASRSQAFRRVVFPALKPINVVVLVVTVIESLRAFDIVFVINSGRNGLELLSVLVYDNIVGEASRIGFGSTLAVILLTVSLAFIIPYLVVYFRATIGRGEVR